MDPSLAEGNNMRLQPDVRRNLVIFLLGFAGVLSLLPLLPQQLALKGDDPPIPVVVLQLLAALQSGALVAGATWLGSVCARRVGLAAPVLQAWSRRQPVWPQLSRQLLPALLGGAIGAAAILAVEALFLPSLPASFVANAERLNVPWYSRVLHGGLTEEVLLRWGAMSFTAWLCYLMIDRGRHHASRMTLLVAIGVSAVLFGLGHLPAAFAISGEVTGPLVGYILFGNGMFGIIAGYLFWKRGLECAMLAHVVVHVIILTAQTLAR